MPWKLDRTYIQRGLCLPQHSKDPVLLAENVLNDELSSYNLTTTKIHMFHCQEVILPLSEVDITFL